MRRFRGIGWFVGALVLTGLPACQPLAGFRFHVVAPPGTESASLEVRVMTAPRQAGLPPEEPEPPTIVRAGDGWDVQLRWYEPAVEATIEVWADVDADGERDPDEPALTLGPVTTDGSGGGCTGDGLTDLGERRLAGGGAT
ncbi:MAG: hypothetical protein AB7S26_22510 [Sandaracinaceae bacterium]